MSVNSENMHMVVLCVLCKCKCSPKEEKKRQNSNDWDYHTKNALFQFRISGIFQTSVINSSFHLVSNKFVTNPICHITKSMSIVD